MVLKGFKYVIIVLTPHILGIHWRLLYYLNPEVANKHLFSFLIFDEPTIIALVFAIAYSIGSAIIIYSTTKWYLIALYAILDAISVFLYYSIDIPLEYVAVFYAIYTGILISSTIFLRAPKNLDDKIEGMKENGMNQRKIARKLNISESKVSRILNGAKS